MLNFCEIQHPKVNQQRPRRARRREIFTRRFNSRSELLVHFFAATCSKKERSKLVQCKKQTVVGILCEQTVSVLFEQRGPKRTKKAENCFASAEATWGSAPRPRRLLKKAGENFHPWQPCGGGYAPQYFLSRLRSWMASAIWTSRMISLPSRSAIVRATRMTLS